MGMASGTPAVSASDGSVAVPSSWGRRRPPSTKKPTQLRPAGSLMGRTFVGSGGRTMSATRLATALGRLHALAAARVGAEVTDRELLERYAQRRDEAAFAALVRRHAGLVW